MTESGADPAPSPPSTERLLQAFAAEAVTHVVGLADSISAPLLAGLSAHGIRFVRVTREGEAFAIASGLWLGGAHPLVMLQNAGLLESGDGLRGTAMRMGVPLVTLVTCRGYKGLSDADRRPPTGVRPRETLVEPELDTAGLFTESTLSAWGVPAFHCESADDMPNVAAAFEAARSQERPVALLLTRVPE